jgi:hypothetical protein
VVGQVRVRRDWTGLHATGLEESHDLRWYLCKHSRGEVGRGARKVAEGYKLHNVAGGRLAGAVLQGALLESIRR